MNEYEKLVTEINRQILSLQEKVNRIQNDSALLRLNSKLYNLLNQDTSLDNLLTFLTTNIPNSELISLVRRLIVLKELENIVESSNINLSLEELESIAFNNQTLDEEEKEYIYKNLKNIIQVQGYISSPFFNDQVLLEGYNEIKQNLLNFLRKKYDFDFRTMKSSVKEDPTVEFKLNKNSKQEKDYLEEIEKLNYYLTLISIDGIQNPFKNSRELEEFFEFLGFIKDSDIDKLKIAKDFAKFNLDYLSNSLDELRRARRKINKNSNIINTGIENTVNPQQEPSEENIEDLLNDEEKNIYDKIKLILEEKSDVPLFNEIKELLGDNLDCEIRKGLYVTAKGIEWSTIVSDIKLILIPKIKNRKDEVFRIFRFTLDLYDENKKNIDGFKEIKVGIQEIISENSALFRMACELTEEKRKFFEYNLKVLKSGSKEEIEDIKHRIDKSTEFYEFVLLLSSLKELQDMVDEYISSSNNSSSDLSFSYNAFNDILSEYKKIDRDKVYSNAGNEKTPENGNNFTSLTALYFLEDDFSSYNEKQKKELKEAIKKLSSRTWEDLSSETSHLLNEVYYTKPNGKRDYYDGEKFKPLRIRGNSGSRTGIIKIDVCAENQQKIMKRYNLRQFGPLILIIGSIIVLGEDHSAYDDINVYIRKNKERIDSIVDLFNNPNADEGELFDMIEKGIKDTKKILSGQFGEGAKSI